MLQAKHHYNVNLKKVCPYTSRIYAILQQIYVQFCLDLQIKVPLITVCFSTRVIIHLSLLLILELHFYGRFYPC